MTKGSDVNLFKMEYDDICIIGKRLNRFVVEVNVGDRVAYAHINNTGRLEQLFVKGRKGFCIRRSGKGSTSYRLFAIEFEDLAALIDTKIQEKAFIHSVNRKLLPWLSDCSIVERDIKVGNSVLDLLIRCGDTDVYCELKSAIMVNKDGVAMYPDAPSIRGRRHIAKLIELKHLGYAALLVFLAAIPKARAFKPNIDIDREIYNLVVKAIENGVIVKAVALSYNPISRYVVLNNPEMPIVI